MRSLGIAVVMAWLCLGNSAARAAACETPATPLLEAICADKNATKDLTALQAHLEAALKRLSPEGRALLEESQRRWEDRIAATCVAFPKKLKEAVAETNPDPTNCVRHEFERRIAFLDAQGRRVGDFLWQDIDRAEDLYCFAGKDERGINLFQLTWTWLRIDAPASPATRKWNAVHQISHDDIETDRNGSDPCELGGYQNREVTLIFGQDDFVDIENKADWSGLNHGMYTSEAHIEIISTGKHLAAEDFFKPGSGWQAFIASRLFADSGADGTENSLANFETYATEIQRWSVNAKTLTYSFGPYELGGYASTMQSTFTWKELRPYLREDLPFRPDFN